MTTCTWPSCRVFRRSADRAARRPNPARPAATGPCLPDSQSDGPATDIVLQARKVSSDMTRYLAVLIWPVGLAVIFAAAWLLATPAPAEPDRAPGSTLRRGTPPAAGADSAAAPVMPRPTLPFLTAARTS